MEEEGWREEPWKAWGDWDSLPLSSDEEEELGDVERREPLVVFEWEDESESWRVEVLVRAALGTLPSLFTFLKLGRSRTEPEEASGAGGRAAQRRPSIVRFGCLVVRFVVWVASFRGLDGY